MPSRSSSCSKLGSVPFKGYAVHKFGPRFLVVAGGVLVGASWAMNAYAETLNGFYLAAFIGGTGAAAVYGTCVGNALKWFPDRRGLAAGLTAMGFGVGSALTVSPIYNMIQSPAYGYQAAFLYFGIGQGVIVFLLGWFLRSPDARAIEEQYPGREVSVRPQFGPLDIARAPVFWVMYLMFVMMAAGGLMAVAQLGPIAADFKIADTPVTLGRHHACGIALRDDTRPRLKRFLSRPFFGWVSDRIGRENTMFLAFAFEGALAFFLPWALWAEPHPVRYLERPRLLRLGRDLQPVSSPLHRHVRLEIRRVQRRASLHGKGDSRPADPLHERLGHALRLEGRVLRCRKLNIAAALLAVAVLKPLRKRHAALNG